MNDNNLIFGLMATFGKNEYSFSDLAYLCNPFDVSESSLRTNLSRMSKKGHILIKRKGRIGYYSFSEKGNIIKNNFAKSFEKLDWSDWNGSFWGILFSIPESKKYKRYKIRKKLILYRFVSLYPGFWIRPFNSNEKIEKYLNDIFNNENCRIIKFFNYKNLNTDVISELWQLKNINNNFKKGLKILSDKSKKIINFLPKQALREKMYTGGKIVDLLFKDPLLPDSFLPDDWKGDKLKKEFKIWDKITTEKSKPYWEKIFK